MIECPEYSDLIGSSHDDINCWELVVELYKRAGLELENYDISHRAVKLVCKKMELVKCSGDWEEVVCPSAMDVVSIRVIGSFVSHCGLCIGNGKFIHSLEDFGVIISKFSDPLWKNKLAGFFKYVGN